MTSVSDVILNAERARGRDSNANIARLEIPRRARDVVLLSPGPRPRFKTAPRDRLRLKFTDFRHCRDAGSDDARDLGAHRVDVENRENAPLTIKRIDVISVGSSGAYTLAPTSVPFDEHVNPGEKKIVEFYAAALLSDPKVNFHNLADTSSPPNDPVTIRLTLFYRTPAGAFQSIVMQQVQNGG